MCTDRRVIRIHVHAEPSMTCDMLQVNTSSAVRASGATARESADRMEPVTPVVATTNSPARSHLVRMDVILDVNLI